MINIRRYIPMYIFSEGILILEIENMLHIQFNHTGVIVSVICLNKTQF